MLRISIGHRLFASVLLAILAVTATGVVLMRLNVASSFADYAAQIELDRLQGLSQSLARQYRAQGDWSFVGKPPGAWLEQELARQRSTDAALPPPTQAPTMAPTTAAPVASTIAAPLASAVAPNGASSAAQPPLTPVPAAPPVPPLPPIPPLPPLPLPPVAPEPLSFDRRITLLAADRSYLAGLLVEQSASVSRPITLDGQIIGYLAIARSELPSDTMSSNFLDQQKASLAIILLASLVLSALAASLLAAHFRKPIRQLHAGAAALAAGRLDTRLDVPRSDELGELAASFNRLAAQLEAAEGMRRAWVADTSHELRTPVSVLRAQIEAMQDGVRPATPENLAILARQILALNKLIDELYVLARADVGELAFDLRRTELWPLVEECAQAFAEKLAAAGLRLELRAPAHPIFLHADPDRLRQVFGNLLENAARYTAAGGQVLIHAAPGPASVTLYIDDSAPGVPADALPRLGERFFRIDRARDRQHGGAGLGLALCVRIAEAHGGTITFHPAPLGGLRASLVLPAE